MIYWRSIYQCVFINALRHVSMVVEFLCLTTKVSCIDESLWLALVKNVI